MAESEYYEILKQEEKNSDQQYFSNVEDQTVQYVITPNKTQTQFPTQQIVVARGDQLMLLNGQPQQIFIDQSVIPYQAQEIQLQAQPRQQIKQVMRLATPTTPHPQAAPGQAQPAVRPPNVGQPPTPRPPTPVRQQPPAALHARHLGVGVVRQPAAGQQIRLTTLSGQLRQQPPPRASPALVGQQRFQVGQPQKAKGQDDAEDSENKSALEQDTISMPDGSIVTVGAYKKMLSEQKIKNNMVQKMTPPPLPPHQPSLLSVGTPAAKRRPPAPRPPRLPARGAAARPLVRPPGQFLPPPPPGPRPPKDPAQFAMMGQPPPAGNKPPAVYQSLQQQIQQQSQLLQQQQQQQFQQQQQQLQQQHQMQQQLQQQMAQEQLRQSQANFVIQPPRANQKPQQQRPLPAYIPSSQIQKIIESTPISEEFSDSIRMLVLLENGEQRLITFTLPKEACTIQEILEQVNVPFQSHTNIQVTEANSNGINYIVTVGNVPPLGYEEDDSQQPPQQDPSPPPPPAITPAASPAAQGQPQPQRPLPPLTHLSPPGEGGACAVGAAAPLSPEPPKDVPRLVAGMLALCGACGYLSEDFNKCIRCNRKLPDNVKSIPATIKTSNGQKKEMLARQQALQQKQLPIKSSPVQKPPSLVRKKPTKKQSEQESVHVISSDEEVEEEPSKLTENILQKLGASVTISPVTKEPSVNDIQRHPIQNATASFSDQPNDIIRMKLKCRTVRIGSYRCIPLEEIQIDSTQTVLQVPHPTREKEAKTIRVEKGEVVKVLASFNSSLAVVFYYLSPSAAAKIRADLDMTPGGPYYLDPLALDEESHRRITLLPDDIDDADKNLMQLIFDKPANMLDELNVKEANDILIKTCPKDLAKAAMGFGTFTEIKQLLTYPPEGKGRIAINTEDYICLGQDQFLNDVIIDFYLKYLVANLPEDQKRKVHVFSTFFYKRLTTKASRKSQPAELDATLTQAEKRHARVKTWTKNVNLFEKDFVVVPINENAHWFLAIICFPGMDGCQTWDGKPYKLETRSRAKKRLSIGTIGAVSVTAVKQEKSKPILCDDPELSDKDEAEGDDSELESDDSEEVPATQQPVLPPMLAVTQSPRAYRDRPPIKQPCILIFDSLAGANRSRVVATLRDYLTCEYKMKMGKERVYNKDVIKGANPKVPQQNNFTDCGLYVLQYVEQFFKDPIKDYSIPIREIQNWFEEAVVTRKREEIADLLRSLMEEYGKDTRLLPEITFPTLNGKLIERDPAEEEVEEEEEEEEPSAGEGGASPISSGARSDAASDDCASPLKPSNDGRPGDFSAQAVIDARPDLSELPRLSSKDTLSILKAKRINRHKTAEEPMSKKPRGD